MTEADATPLGHGEGPIDRVIHALNRSFVVLASVALILMMLHVTAEVAARATGWLTLIGTLEIVSYYYMILLVMLPMGFVELRNEHIRVDLFVQMMPQRVQLALYVLSCILCIVFFSMMLWQSFLDAWNSMLRKETIMSNYIFYIWPSRWALPIGFFGLLLAAVCNLLKSIRHRKAL
ncbi:MAG TPA: TRAP transporter small permease [Roseovarius sp.]|nr:TRAP transporter small permease [Roseovarius sp.]